MAGLTIEQKYAQQEVVEFWQKLSREGLQKCEQEMVRRYLPDEGHLLDVGCGTGRAVLALTEAGYRVTGIDLSLDMLAGGRTLSKDAPLNAANIMALPFADHSFEAIFMFFGALQHIPGRNNRQRTIREMTRITRPGGRLLLGLDNIAPALTCYFYWARQKLFPSKQIVTSAALRPQAVTTGADAVLWRRETRQVHPLVWHLRGLSRTLRWRTWTGLVDSARRLAPLSNGTEPGDTQVAQFGLPPTPGRIYYHIYQADELIEDAHQAGWYLLGFHSGTELNEDKRYPLAIRQSDKQLFFAFRRRD